MRTFTKGKGQKTKIILPWNYNDKTSNFEKIYVSLKLHRFFRLMKWADWRLFSAWIGKINDVVARGFGNHPYSSIQRLKFQIAFSELCHLIFKCNEKISTLGGIIMKSSSSVVIRISLNESIHIKTQMKPKEPNVKNIQRQFKCGHSYFLIKKFKLMFFCIDYVILRRSKIQFLN